jgi:(p)ppGpp synthase/HD superfamily hydrolase
MKAHKFIQAYVFAEQKHRTQRDDNGEPYIDHPVRVYYMLCNVTKDDDVLYAALLHDTIEDTDTTYQELVDNFGQRVADLVNEVTHEGTNDSHGYYFPRLHSKEGIIIKFADRLDNISRMDTWAPDRIAQYLRKSKFWKSEPAVKEPNCYTCNLMPAGICPGNFGVNTQECIELLNKYTVKTT